VNQISQALTEPEVNLDQTGSEQTLNRVPQLNQVFLISNHFGKIDTYTEQRLSTQSL
jgi:hypothetical protein